MGIARGVVQRLVLDVLHFGVEMRRLFLCLATIATTLPAQQKGKAAAPSSAPLAQYTSVKVAVAPVQFYRSDTAFVNTVYENVVGAAPSPAELEFFVGLLAGSGGTMSQGQLLALAASTDANALNIDLVGLQQSGVEFA